jgi:hypothetical protein
MPVHPNSIKNLVAIPKGVSGNPSGRPKGNKKFSLILKKVMEFNPDFLIKRSGEDFKQWYDSLAEDEKIYTWKELLAVRVAFRAIVKNDMHATELILSQLGEDKAKKIELTNIEEGTKLEEMTNEQLQSIADGTTTLDDVGETEESIRDIRVEAQEGDSAEPNL